MSQLPVPFLNRLVDAMLDHADPKADQNIWNLARAAEEVMRAAAVDRFFQTGDPTVLGGYQPSPEQASRPVGPLPSPTGRMHVNPVPLTFSTDPAQGYQPPDYAAQVAEIEKILGGDPYATGSDVVERVRSLANANYEGKKEQTRLNKIVQTADTELSRIGRSYVTAPLDARLVQVIRGFDSQKKRLEIADKLLREAAHALSPEKPLTTGRVPETAEALRGRYDAALRELEELRNAVSKLSVAQDVLDQIRKALDPDGQFEDESLIVLARERMSQRAARGQERDELRRKVEGA